MCGIAGLWSMRGVADRASVVTMSNAMTARGPDGDGFWSSADQSVVFGHRRLAIIDVSSGGAQPMTRANGRYTVTFNGEIYNYRELRAELMKRGSTFTSDSDTEVLLEAFAVWGEACLSKLYGMYAFALWDDASKRLLLARDRAGEKPLYYSHTPSRFAFASDFNAIRTLPGLDTRIDQDALALYLRYQSIPAPWSIYESVRKLPAAHSMTVHAGRAPEIKRYWDPRAYALQTKLDVSDEEAQRMLSDTIDRAVRRQMVADVPLGAFLSGGIDSTVVVSAMTRASSQKVKTFTIGFDEARFDESPQALAVAKHLGTDHTEERLTEKNTLALVEQIPSVYGEPFADSSALPTYLVSRTARAHVTVSLSGDGGDELFGGYSRYAWFARGAWAARASLPLRMLLPLEPALERAAARFGPRWVSRVSRASALVGRSPQHLAQDLVSLFSEADVSAAVHPAPPSSAFDRAWQGLGPKDVFPRELTRRFMLADFEQYLPDTILVKVDRAAMANSLETRAPFLDPEVIELALRLPTRFLREKILLKRVAYQNVPKALLDRPKTGFGVPMESWMRGPLRPRLSETVRPAVLESLGFRDTQLMMRKIDAHLKGTANHGGHLWALLVLCMWAEHTRAS